MAVATLAAIVIVAVVLAERERRRKPPTRSVDKMARWMGPTAAEQRRRR